MLLKTYHEQLLRTTMFVQWCVKGIRGRITDEPNDAGLTPGIAIELVRGGHGIQCNWCGQVGTIRPNEIRRKLTAANLDLHVNNYNLIYNDHLLSRWPPVVLSATFLSNQQDPPRRRYSSNVCDK